MALKMIVHARGCRAPHANDLQIESYVYMHAVRSDDAVSCCVNKALDIVAYLV